MTFVGESLPLYVPTACQLPPKTATFGNTPQLSNYLEVRIICRSKDGVGISHNYEVPLFSATTPQLDSYNPPPTCSDRCWYSWSNIKSYSGRTVAKQQLGMGFNYHLTVLPTGSSSCTAAVFSGISKESAVLAILAFTRSSNFIKISWQFCRVLPSRNRLSLS